jgi:hypothetical protein
VSPPIVVGGRRWTAERIERGEAATIPASPPLDADGLRMEMLA